MLLCVGVSLLNVEWRVVVSGPAVSQWSPAFDPVWAAKCTRRTHSHFPSPQCLMHVLGCSSYWICYVVFSFLLWFDLCFYKKANVWKNTCLLFLMFQVSHVYALAVFEDYLYALHSALSEESSSVELLQVHRFNITAESRTLASLGNSRALHVYHKLAQPKGKGRFPISKHVQVCVIVSHARLIRSRLEEKYTSLVIYLFLSFIFSPVRSHACEMDSYEKPGGCSHICLLSGSYKSRTCRCRIGYRLGSDGASCKS